MYIVPMKEDINRTKEGKKVNPLMPSPKHYTWYSSLESGGGTNKLRISADHKQYCKNCKYLAL